MYVQNMYKRYSSTNFWHICKYWFQLSADIRVKIRIFVFKTGRLLFLIYVHTIENTKFAGKAFCTKVSMNWTNSLYIEIKQKEMYFEVLTYILSISQFVFYTCIFVYTLACPFVMLFNIHNIWTNSRYYLIVIILSFKA